jgi:apolipoprotein N-acyltransferase
MSKAHGKQSAGLTMVPSSDWKGIDPYHTQMTRIRAIEGGFSVIRPVRWATSAAYDAYGRLRAAMPYDEGGRIMLVTLPVKPVATLYEKVGDWPVVGAFIVVAVCTVLLFVRRRV